MGMLFGSPLLAYFAQLTSHHVVLVSAGIGLYLLFCILLTHALNAYVLLTGLFFVMGILCCYQVIVFSE